MVLGLRLPGAGERFDDVLVEHTRPLLPGDVIVLYTDGITEAMDADGRVVRRRDARPRAGGRAALGTPPASASASCATSRAFVGDAEPHDDMTMVILKLGWGGMTWRRIRVRPRDAPVEVFRSHSSIEAEVVCGLLAAHEIDSVVSLRAVAVGVSVSASATANSGSALPSGDADRARELIAGHLDEAAAIELQPAERDARPARATHRPPLP